MEEFANNIMAKCGWDYMRAIQYLDHCIKSCYWHNDTAGIDKFAGVRDYIENKYMDR